MPTIPFTNTPGIDTVFLDRDGTVIEDRDYLDDPEGVTLLPGAGEALGRLCGAGVKLFLVTNQSGIGRGYFSEADMERCQARLNELLEPFNACFTGVRFCPHAPGESCDCRKPELGMWQSLAEQYDLNPSRCAMVGDKPDDIKFGVRAGFSTCFLVLTGKGKESAAGWGAHLAPGLDSAPLGSEPMPSSGWISMLDRDLKPIMGGTTEQFPEDGMPSAKPFAKPSAAPSPNTPADPPLTPTRTALWLARDLNAVADKVLSS